MTRRASAVVRAAMRWIPHQARGKSDCEDAWWYEKLHSIHVYCYSKTRGHMHCRIDRAAIEGWLNRARLAAAQAKKGKR